MKKEYDFSNAKKNPYIKALKKSITIRLDADTVAYFQNLASENEIPYQTLINLYLKDCVRRNRKIAISW